MPKARASLLRNRIVFVTIAAGVFCACQTSMTQMTSARALKPLHFEAAVNMSGSFNSSIVNNSIDAGETLVNAAKEDTTTEVSEEDLRKILDGTIAWLLFRPSATPELIARMGVYDGILEGIDVGVRYNGALIKGDAKLQVWESADGSQAIAIDAGYAYHLGVVGSIFEFLTLTEFKRSDIDASVMWSWEHPDILKIYASPRFIASHVATEPKLPDFVREKLPADVAAYNPAQYFQDEWMVHYGATAGLLVGYKYVFLSLELTAMYVQFKPKIINQRRDYSGVVIAPAIGLVGTY